MIHVPDAGSVLGKRAWWQRFSLGLQMAFISFGVGLVTWFIVDHFQSGRLQKLFDRQLSLRLEEEGREDRTNFDRFVKLHSNAAQVFVSQYSFSEYIEKFPFNSDEPVKISRLPPPWLPSTSVQRAILNIRYALLLDGDGNVREVYQGWDTKLPDQILSPSDYLKRLSHDQNYITDIDGKPFLLAASYLTNDSGEMVAGFLIIAPVDDEFLVSSQPLNRNTLIALVNEQNEIVASNRQDILPTETNVDEIAGEYLVSGRSHFDYGASEVLLDMVSFVSRQEYIKLNATILSAERKERIFIALVLYIFFSALIFSFTRRVNWLTRRIRNFAGERLAIQLHESETGDELFGLESIFQQFQQELDLSYAQLEKANLSLEEENERRRSAEKKLLEHTENLENIVRERTAELEAKKNEAEAADRAKSEFLSNISHEFKTPLNSLIGFSELMLKGIAGELQEEQKEYVQDIHSSALHLLSLINDVLELVRFDSGSRQLVFNEFDVKILLEGCMISVREKAGKRNLDLQCIVAEDAGFIVGDERRFKQVLLYLLDNAIKFTPDNGRITLAASRKDTMMEIRVHDTGVGISPENLESVFEPFYQEQSGIRDKNSGTGLGLTVVRRFISIHRGRIWVESDGPGKGSTFVVQLPVLPVEDIDGQNILPGGMGEISN